MLWTDVFQICMMFAGLIAVLIRGSMDFDGFSNIWKFVDEGERIEFFKYAILLIFFESGKITGYLDQPV